MRKKCRSRAAIEPIIGHVKSDCRMARNFLKGNTGNDINTILAAVGFNLRGLLRKIKKEILWPIFLWLNFPQNKFPKQYLSPKF